MDLYQRPGSRYWVADFTVNGVRYRKSTKQTGKSAALAVAMDLYRTLQQAPKHDPGLTLAGFAIEHFIPYVKACGREPKTKKDYQYGWFLLQGQDIAKMRLDSIRSHHVDMIDVPGSPSTHNCALRTLRRMFSIAVDLGLTTNRPNVHLKRENKRTTLISPNVEEKIAAVLAKSKRKGSLQAGMYVILDAGMRPAEIAAMRVEHVDFAAGLIYVPRSKTEAGERYLPMTTRVKELLFALAGARERGWLFPSPRYAGQHIQAQALTQAWARARRQAGVHEDAKLYCARHTFGTDAMTATKNPFKVQRMLGHTALSTTARYQHHEIAEMGEMMDQRNKEREEKSAKDRRVQ